jgi:hypothetical protein
LLSVPDFGYTLSFLFARHGLAAMNANVFQDWSQIKDLLLAHTTRARGF